MVQIADYNYKIYVAVHAAYNGITIHYTDTGMLRQNQYPLLSNAEFDKKLDRLKAMDELSDTAIPDRELANFTLEAHGLMAAILFYEFEKYEEIRRQLAGEI